MKRQRGFTLVELLVALVLLGLLAGVLFAALGLGGRVWEAAHVHLDDDTRLAVAQDALRRELSAAVPWRPPGAGPEEAVLFEGGPDALTMVTAAPAAVGGGLALVELRRTAGRLVLEWGVLHADGTRAPRTETALVEEVSALRLSYLGPPPSGGMPWWTEDWRGRAELPLLVKIEVETTPPWPELVIRPAQAGWPRRDKG